MNYDEIVGESKPDRFIRNPGKNTNAFDEQNTEDAAGKPNKPKENGEKGKAVGSVLSAAAKVVGQFTQEKTDWSNLNR